MGRLYKQGRHLTRGEQRVDRPGSAKRVDESGATKPDHRVTWSGVLGFTVGTFILDYVRGRDFSYVTVWLAGSAIIGVSALVLAVQVWQYAAAEFAADNAWKAVAWIMLSLATLGLAGYLITTA